MLIRLPSSLIVWPTQSTVKSWLPRRSRKPLISATYIAQVHVRNSVCAKFARLYSMAEPARTQKIQDPRVLRAIAHPMRQRVLGELSAAGHLRAADVAERLCIPAILASFHLRQLSMFGLVVPAPELARDGRDRVWKPVHEHGRN